jgi:hypothetical protein
VLADVEGSKLVEAPAAPDTTDVPLETTDTAPEVADAEPEVADI